MKAAEQEPDPEKRKAWLTFVIVGGGPTGVELAGAIAELAFNTLKADFRTIDTTEAKILLVEGLDRVLPPFPPELSEKAAQALVRLGVTVQTKSMVSNIADHVVTIKQGDAVQQVPARTILWAAGVKASAMGKVLEQQAGAKLDRVGRVMVEPDLSIAGHPNIFVVGDLSNYMHQGDKPLPGVAPVAVQEGKFVAKLIQQRISGKAPASKFVYNDSGSLAVIGQNEAVVNLRSLKLSGPIAWFIWIFAHIYYLIEFDNKMIVTIEWTWNYFTRSRGARLITGESSLSNDYVATTEKAPVEA